MRDVGNSVSYQQDWTKSDKRTWVSSVSKWNRANLSQHLYHERSTVEGVWWRHQEGHSTAICFFPRPTSVSNPPLLLSFPSSFSGNRWLHTFRWLQFGEWIFLVGILSAIYCGADDIFNEYILALSADGHQSLPYLWSSGGLVTFFHPYLPRRAQAGPPHEASTPGFTLQERRKHSWNLLCCSCWLLNVSIMKANFKVTIPGIKLV